MTALVSNREQRRFMAQMLMPSTRLLGIPLTDWRKSTSRSVVMGGTAAGGDLGLPNGAGQAMQGTSTNATSATDAARVEVCLPEGYAAGGPVTVKVRTKVNINRFVAQTIAISAKEVTDNTVGAELCVTSATSITTSYADYGFSLTSIDLAAGDVLALVLTVVSNDTGGAAGASVIFVARTWLKFAGT